MLAFWMIPVKKVMKFRKKVSYQMPTFYFSVFSVNLHESTQECIFDYVTVNKVYPAKAVNKSCHWIPQLHPLSEKKPFIIAHVTLFMFLDKTFHKAPSLVDFCSDEPQNVVLIILIMFNRHRKWYHGSAIIFTVIRPRA